MSSTTLKRLIIFFAIVASLSIPTIYLVGLLRSFASFSDAYASDWMAIFVIDHLRTSDHWPDGWDDLRDEYDRLAPEDQYAWTFDELQTRVWFNWKADPNEVRTAVPPQEIFRLTSGRKVSFNGDPNKLIQDYLRTGEDPWRINPPAGQNEGPERADSSMRVNDG